MRGIKTASYPSSKSSDHPLKSFRAMHFLTSITRLSAIAAITVSSVTAAPASTSLQTRADSFVGYLVSTFSDVTPAVQFHLSKGNDAGSYTFLNKGQPVLKSTVGTKGVRDVFLAHDSARTNYYMIATGELEKSS